MQQTLPPRTGFDEMDDPFQRWCWDRGYVLPEQQAAAFGQYLHETTGFVWETPPDLVG